MLFVLKKTYQDKIEELERKNADALEKAESRDRLLAVEIEQKQKLLDMLNEKESRITSLVADRDDLAGKISTFENRLNTFEEQVKVLSDEKEKYETLIADLKADKARADEQILSLQHSVDDAEVQIEQFSVMAKEKDARIDLLLETSRRHNMVIEELRSNNESLCAEKETLLKQYEKSQIDLDAIREKLVKAEEERGHFEHNNIILENELKTVKDELCKNTSELDRLREENETLKGDCASLWRYAEAVRSGLNPDAPPQIVVHGSFPKTSISGENEDDNADDEDDDVRDPFKDEVGEQENAVLEEKEQHYNYETLLENYKRNVKECVKKLYPEKYEIYLMNSRKFTDLEYEAYMDKGFFPVQLAKRMVREYVPTAEEAINSGESDEDVVTDELLDKLLTDVAGNPDRKKASWYL